MYALETRRKSSYTKPHSASNLQPQCNLSTSINWMIRAGYVVAGHLNKQQFVKSYCQPFILTHKTVLRSTLMQGIHVQALRDDETCHKAKMFFRAHDWCNHAISTCKSVCNKKVLSQFSPSSFTIEYLMSPCMWLNGRNQKHVAVLWYNILPQKYHTNLPST